MKCEYCENEIPSNAAETCPFCGSSLVNNQESYGGRVVAGEVIDVTCPHCHSVYEIALEEWGESRHCEVCHNQFPLVYGAISSSQLEHIFLLRVLKVTKAWRKKGLLVPQASGDVSLKAGEIFYCKLVNVTLSESRGVRRTISERTSRRDYNHGYVAFSDRIRKTGEQYRYEGHSETNTDYEYRELDTGTLYLTSRRMFFVGNQMQRYIDLGRIVSFVPYYGRGAGEIRVSEEYKQKVVRFTADDGFCKFSIAMKALRDPNFRRFLTNGSDEDVAREFMKLDYFRDYMPQSPKALPAPEPMQPEPTQEETSAYEFPPIVKTIMHIVVVITVLLSISLFVASKFGISFGFALVVVTVVIGIIGIISCDGVRYQVGDQTYTDVSGMNLIATQIASFKAGMRGDSIITDWDKMNGTWDRIVEEGGGAVRI